MKSYLSSVIRTAKSVVQLRLVTNGGIKTFWELYHLVQLRGTAWHLCPVGGALCPVPGGTACPTGPIPRVPVGAVLYRPVPLAGHAVRLPNATFEFVRRLVNSVRHCCR
jgi:hypothetical protein